MKKLIYIFLFLVTWASCKESDMDRMSAGVVDGLTGTWYLHEVQKTSLDNNYSWEPVAAGKKDTLVFRYDGVMLQTDGKPRCCSPKTLEINGVLRDIIPQTPLAANEVCATVNCSYCPIWQIELRGNEMIVSACNGIQVKYIR